MFVSQAVSFTSLSDCCLFEKIKNGKNCADISIFPTLLSLQNGEKMTGKNDIVGLIGERSFGKLEKIETYHFSLLFFLGQTGPDLFGCCK